MAHPSSLSTSLPEEIPTSAPRTTSLAAAAVVNAGIQREVSNEESISRRGSTLPAQQPSPGLPPRSPVERQRNSVAMNLNLNDPTLPSAGEFQATSPSPSQARASSRTIHSPTARNAESRSRSSSIANLHHGRQPSVGEVYQEMEQEQEAQVNRLLQTIRQQQHQIQALQGSGTATIADVLGDRNPFIISDIDQAIPQSPVATAERARRPSQISLAPIRSVPTGHQLSQALSNDQETALLSSGANTPALPTPASSVSGATGNGVAFYQAELQNLTRENQMLKARIRELESQMSNSQTPTSDLRSLSLNSPLSTEQSADENVAPHEAR